jgi:hypothetical protein
MIGISLVQNNVDWVFFCDDDLLFFPDTLLNVSAVLENRDDMSIKGIGGKLEMFEELNNYPSIRNGTNKFKIKSYQPGKVLKSGDVTQYVHFDEKIHVDWLNGASIWRQDIARKYRFDFLSAKYSAYEDVIFSYQFGKERALFFDPVIRLRFQDEQPQDVSDFMRFSSTQYWKLYFVVSNPELSKRSFLISHAILSIKYLIGSQMKSKILYKEIFKVVILFWKITNLVCKRSGANEILRNVL